LETQYFHTELTQTKPNYSMKFLATAAAILSPILSAIALSGQIGIHDPSTVTECDGKYYAFGTGGGGLMSSDGWNWTNGAVRPGGGVAPDVIHIGDRYYVYWATGGSGQGEHSAAVHVMWSKTLDPKSPDFKFEEGGIVASSDGFEDCNAIDPAVLLDPVSGKLYLTYGSYFGYIRLVELDPKTGKRIDPNDKPVNLAINCEASCMIYHDGWYYLLATHGSCCRGSDSGYNIRVGRAKSVTGPFIDNMGVPMLEGGGKLVIGSGGRLIGPGHFGLIDLGGDVQKFSMHWESDLDRGGASVLDVRPLLWKDGWPVAGENFSDGAYEIASVRTGTALELAVEGVPVGGARVRGAGFGGGGRPGGAGRGGPGATNRVAGTNGSAGPRPGGFGGGGGGGMFAGRGGVIAAQDVAQVSTNWPAGNIDVRMANYLCQAQQKWIITAITNAPGYLGSPYFKISIAGSDRTLAATADRELVSVPSFTGGDEQLWRFDQLTDGTWRIMPKSLPNSQAVLALSAIGSSSVTLAPFDPSSEKQRWLLNAP
jgi:arabinan endo-1,5-alpha-L-arabinosidase